MHTSYLAQRTTMIISHEEMDEIMKINKSQKIWFINTRC